MRAVLDIGPILRLDRFSRLVHRRRFLRQQERDRLKERQWSRRDLGDTLPTARLRTLAFESAPFELLGLVAFAGELLPFRRQRLGE